MRLQARVHAVARACACGCGRVCMRLQARVHEVTRLERDEWYESVDGVRRQRGGRGVSVKEQSRVAVPSVDE